MSLFLPQVMIIKRKYKINSSIIFEEFYLVLRKNTCTFINACSQLRIAIYKISFLFLTEAILKSTHSKNFQNKTVGGSLYLIKKPPYFCHLEVILKIANI